MVGKSTGHPRRPEGAIIDRVSTKEASIRKENFTIRSVRTIRMEI